MATLLSNCLKKPLITNPNDFKHCKLEMESQDEAIAKSLDEPALHIKISGRENVGRYFSGDEVWVEILSRDAGSYKGRVVELIKRNENLTFVCKMVEDNPKLVTPVNKHITRIRTVQTKPGVVEVRQYKFGRWETKEFVNVAECHMLVVKIIKWEDTKTHPLGVVTEVISKGDAPASFKLQEREDENDLERKDLCDVMTFTIDQTKAEDLDDAISVSDMGDSYQMGVHITDVASYISKDSEQDQFARKQGRTIYTEEKGDVAFMFSRELSNDHLSLMPGKERKAVSLLIVVDKKTSKILTSQFALTRIRSNKRMSYEEADQIIQEYYCSDTETLRFSLLEDCVAVAYHFSKVHRKCRLEDEWPFWSQTGQSRSYIMVEELMNLYNSAAAEELLSADVTRDLTPLRCQREPDPERLIEFKDKYTELIPLSPYFSNICDVDREQSESNPELDSIENPFNIFSSVFHKMETFAQSKEHHKLMQLVFSDEIHPTLIPMVREFRDIQKKATILRSCSSTDSRLGHYDLRLNAYTWASSPMRRYLDLILQRLLHTMLSKEHLKEPDYTQTEINSFCWSEVDAEEKHDALMLRLRKVQFEPKDVVKLAVVGQLTPQGHEFTISFPLHPMLQIITIMYKNLKIVDQPRYNEAENSMTLHWKRRVYSSSKPLKNLYLSKSMKNVTPVSSLTWKSLVSAIKKQDWVKIEQCLEDMKRREKEEMKSMMSKASSTQCAQHFREVTLELEFGRVVQVQLGTELNDGFPVPVVQLLNINESFEVCLEHARNPIVCFSNTKCDASKTWYENYEEYQRIWTQLCQIDTAYNALEENNSVILEDVLIKWTSDHQGFFHLTKTRKKQWCLEFDLRNCFLCIRLRRQRPEITEGNTAHLDDGEISDLQGSLPFTWVAHAVTTKPMNKKDEDNKDKIYFQIKQTSMSCKVFDQGTSFTIEILPKKLPYLEQAIANLTQANNLVKSVTTGRPEELNDNTEENVRLYDVDESLILSLNTSQQKAVEEAVKKPFTVIQGPPGTGKTVVGIHIIYQFFMKNKDFIASSQSCHDKKPHKKPSILFCGPSNKSVDIVAEQLLRLKGVLKPLRIYCDQMEMREFPYTGSDLQLTRKSLRDEKPKEQLRDITLMYLVRKPENPFSEKINYFEQHNLSEDEIDDYRKVLKEAHQHEIQKYDVILCTCSSALKPEIQKVMDFRQILIDECAMATEPETFIPLVSHNPQQIILLGDHKQIRPIVQCDLLKKMGMERSLFERYMDLAIMLDTQYRMHEEICRFPSEEFYAGKLITRAERGPCCLLNNHGLPTPILFGHVEGEEVRLVVSTQKGNENSVANTEEAEQAVRVAGLLMEKSLIAPQNIAILTPYNAQVSQIKKTMEKKGIRNVTVCTIMKSQGSEWPYVIVSTVRSCSKSDIQSHEPSNYRLGKRLGFITNPNQVNVAITRAQDGLCILGNSDLLRCCELWKRLLDHYYRKSCVVNPACHIDVKLAASPREELHM